MNMTRSLRLDMIDVHLRKVRILIKHIQVMSHSLIKGQIMGYTGPKTLKMGVPERFHVCSKIRRKLTH